MIRLLQCALVPLLFCRLAGENSGAVAPVPDAPREGSRFRSAEDGRVDISGFPDQDYGFLPVVLPITEPAVGT